MATCVGREAEVNCSLTHPSDPVSVCILNQPLSRPRTVSCWPFVALLKMLPEVLGADRTFNEDAVTNLTSVMAAGAGAVDGVAGKVVRPLDGTMAGEGVGMLMAAGDPAATF